MVDFPSPEPCPHEKAFNQLLQFLGHELSVAKFDDIEQWAMNIDCVHSHLLGHSYNYCSAWAGVVEGINGGCPDPNRPYTYHLTKAKVDELQAQVEKEVAEDAETNQT